MPPSTNRKPVSLKGFSICALVNTFFEGGFRGLTVIMARINSPRIKKAAERMAQA